MGAVLSAGLASRLHEVALGGNSGLTQERAAELAANPNALIDPQARPALPANVLDALQNAMAGAIHNVFWVGTVLAGMALLVSFYLPRAEDGAGNQPTEEECCTETGERMVIAELTTIDPVNEPVARRASSS